MRKLMRSRLVQHENRARNGAILPAGVLFLSHFEQDSPHVTTP